MTLDNGINKAFPKLRKLFSEEKLIEFKNTPNKDLKKYNFGMGTMIRLKLLRPKSALYKLFIQNKFTDREEMSMKIIEAFHYECNE